MKKFKIELSFLVIILAIVVVYGLSNKDYTIPSYMMLIVADVWGDTVTLEDSIGNTFWAKKPAFKCKVGDPVGVSVDLKYHGKNRFEPRNNLVIDFPWKYDEVVWSGMGYGYTPTFMALVVKQVDEDELLLKDNDGNAFWVKKPAFKYQVGMNVVVCTQLRYTENGWAGDIETGEVKFKL